MGNITLTDSYCSFVFLVSDRSFQGNHQICLGGGLRIGVLYGWTQWTWMAQSPAVMLRKGVNPHVSQCFLISFVCFFLKWKKQRTSAWLHPWECFNFIYFKHAFLRFIRKSCVLGIFNFDISIKLHSRHPSETRLEKNRANHFHLPDVILLDIQMPGMTGRDRPWCHLRKDESPRHVKKLSLECGSF